MKKKTKAPFVNVMIFLMFCTCLFLGMKINEKKQWIELPPISSWLPYESWFKNYDYEVSGSIKYQNLSGDYYTNGTNQCNALNDGIILTISENHVVVLNDNGVEVTYGGLNEIMAKVDERIIQGQNLGSYKDSLSLTFKKDGSSMTYEDALKQ